MSSEVKRNENY